MTRNAHQTEQSRANSVLQRLEKLSSPLLSDALDRLGFRHQALSPRIRQVAGIAPLVGYARTVEVDDAPMDEPASNADYTLQLELIDDLAPGDVIVVSHSERASFWGELLATAAAFRGAKGVVIDGYTRDVRALTNMGFPTFVAGVHPTDSLGRLRVTAIDGSIESGGVAVRRGDCVIGDVDGVVVVPVESAEAAIAIAEEKLRDEDRVRLALERGDSLTETFEKYGVL